MSVKLIYVADDEQNICNIIKSFLINEGFDVEIFNDGNSLLDTFYKKPSNMLIIDIMMPGIDGYSLCSRVREISNVPIIMVSAKDSEPDKIAGLTLGSDDYLTKPFSPMELVARVKSIFRRIDLDHNDEKEAENKISFGDISILPMLKNADCKGVNLGLTVMEFRVLTYLIQNKNKAISRDELLNKIWGFESESDTRAVDDMVKRIRKKLSNANSSVTIETIWGFGFTIKERAEDYVQQ